MNASTEIVFHPAMGIGLTAGRLDADTQAARAAADRVAYVRTLQSRRGDAPRRRRNGMDSAHIYQCA